MNRLTYKLNEPIKTKYLNYEYKRIPDYDISRGNYGRISDDMIFNKLGKLEDLEEEIGIDLITLFSALKNGVYYFAKQNQLMFDYVSLISNYIDVGPHDKLSYSFITFYDRQTLSFEDYGKTFALTREELEDE